MIEINKTGYDAFFFMRMRYGKDVPQLPPLGELRTLAEWKTALEAGALREVNWSQLHPEMIRALIEKLARQLQKPLHWLNDDDFSVPLEGFRHPDKAFNLRPLIARFRANRSGSDAIFVLLNELKMLGPTEQKYLPFENLREIKMALEKGWLKPLGISWDLISPEIQRAMVLDLANGRELYSLGAKEITSDPVPSLRYRDPRTGEMEDFRLRGLYARYYAASRSTPFDGPTFMITRLWPGVFPVVRRGTSLTLSQVRPLAMLPNSEEANLYATLKSWDEKHGLVTYRVPLAIHELVPFAALINAIVERFGQTRRFAKDPTMRKEALRRSVFVEWNEGMLEFLRLHDTVLFGGQFFELKDHPELKPLVLDAYKKMTDDLFGGLSRLQGSWNPSILRATVIHILQLAHMDWNTKNHRKGFTAMIVHPAQANPRLLAAA
jgi:hypothetical protein